MNKKIEAKLVINSLRDHKFLGILRRNLKYIEKIKPELSKKDFYLSISYHRIELNIFYLHHVYKLLSYAVDFFHIITDMLNRYIKISKVNLCLSRHFSTFFKSYLNHLLYMILARNRLITK